MEREINDFISYLHNIKKTSNNTELSYKRDLGKLRQYLEEKGITDVKDITAEDEELKSFLFSLGCYSGEPVTVISHIKGGCVVSIKDARYNIDTDLAQAISI